MLLRIVDIGQYIIVGIAGSIGILGIVGIVGMYRPRPIMLKIRPIMLLSSAQKLSLLCSILCS